MNSRQQEFRDYDNPLVELERPRKPKRPRRLSAWEAQAEKWTGPCFSFKCCGTIYRAMNDVVLQFMKNAHRARHQAEAA